MTVEFELEGQKFLALNGGPQFKFDEAVSFQVFCETQARGRLLLEQACRRRQRRPVRLAEGQVRPVMAGGAHRRDRAAAETATPQRPDRVMKEILQMRKIDIAALQKAYAA